MLIGAIEAGGTKFVCGIDNKHGVILDSAVFPTEAPVLTMKKVIEYFRLIIRCWMSFCRTIIMPVNMLLASLI